MAKLTNNSKRGYGLPARVRDTEQVHSAVLSPGARVDVPEWYVDELRSEPGIAALMGRELLVEIDDRAAAKKAKPHAKPKAESSSDEEKG